MPEITRSRLLATVVLVGSLGVGGIWGISSAQAAAPGGEAPSPTCKSWNDGTTYGVSCNRGTYEAQAQCSDGTWLRGSKVNAPATSYVYCSSVGAKYVRGTGHAAMFGG